VVIEFLDFGKKKQSLGEQGAGYARMLSGLVYAKYRRMAASAAARAGVELIRINPFATSVIGQLNFMPRYGLSSHGAAACVIARRGLGLRLEKAITGNGFPLPERKRTTRGNYWLRVCRSVRKMRFADRLDLSYAARF
jgi:hypothetical protein